MSFWLIALIIYIVTTIGFFAAIQFERINQGAELNPFQFIVAIFWPVWVIWYLWIMAKEALEDRRARR